MSELFVELSWEGQELLQLNVNEITAQSVASNKLSICCETVPSECVKLCLVMCF